MTLFVSPTHDSKSNYYRVCYEPSYLESVQTYWKQGLERDTSVVSRITTLILLTLGTLFFYGVLNYRKEQKKAVQISSHALQQVPVLGSDSSYSLYLPRTIDKEPSPLSMQALAKEKGNDLPLFSVLNQPLLSLPSLPYASTDGQFSMVSSELQASWEPKIPLHLPPQWQPFVVEPKETQVYAGPAPFPNLSSFDIDRGILICSGLPPHFTLMIGNISLLHQQWADVIVNAANSHLQGGRGIDGAIHQEGGATYAKSHRNLSLVYGATYQNPCYPIGAAALIPSGNLYSKNYTSVIVVAGPSPGHRAPTVDEINGLYRCYYNSLYLAGKRGIESVAFPLISTAIFGFPEDLAAQVSLRAISDYALSHLSSSVKKVLVCAYNPTQPDSLEGLMHYKNALLSN